MSPGVNKCFNSFFVVSIIIVLSMMKMYVQKCCRHCRRFTDSVAVQYLGDPGLHDNLEELLAYCAEATIGKN